MCNIETNGRIFAYSHLYRILFLKYYIFKNFSYAEGKVWVEIHYAFYIAYVVQKSTYLLILPYTVYAMTATTATATPALDANMHTDTMMNSITAVINITAEAVTMIVRRIIVIILFTSCFRKAGGLTVYYKYL